MTAERYKTYLGLTEVADLPGTMPGNVIAFPALPDFAAAGSLDAAIAMLARLVAPLGFTAINYGCVNYSDSIASTMDRDWIAHYREAELWRTDPLVSEARRRVDPFLVSDIIAGPAGNAAEAQMFGAIAEVPRGVVVPIHCPQVGASVASFLTGMDERTLAARAPGLMGTLTFYAMRFHEAVTRFYRDGPGTDIRKGLSKREREVLTLSSRGKTSHEIGAILGISETTVNNHVGRLLRKLNVATRAQAIALALQTGQIARTN